MVGLLDLPLELREPILLDVVLDTIEQQPAQPRIPSEVDNGGYRSVEVADHDPTSMPDRVFCKSLSRHAMQLLHINQQIRDEVIAIVFRRLGQRIDDARLDATFAVDPAFLSSMWATWLSAPFPTFHINTLHAQIRFFEVTNSMPSFHTITPWNNILKDCDEWVDSHVAGILLSFIATSVSTQAGSASVHERQRITTTKRSLPSYRTIQKLVLDIPVDPNIPNAREGLVRCLMCPGAPLLSEGEFFCMIPSGKRAALVFAKSLHEKLLEIFNKVGGPFYETAIPRLIFERVGTIELNVRGRLFGHVKLGQILATVPHTEDWFSTELTRTEFFTWKRAAEDKRRTAGFGTVNPSVQEHHLQGAAGLISSILAARDVSLLGEVAEISDDDVQPAGQPASGEQVAFTGKTLLVQGDGSRVPGDATFYCPANKSWSNMHNYDDFHFPGFASDYPGERSRKEEHVLFEGEAIVFPRFTPETIISGDAIFFGREESIAEQPPALSEVVLCEMGDHHDASGI